MFSCTSVFFVAALFRCSGIIIVSHGCASGAFVLRESVEIIRGERLLFWELLRHEQVVDVR